MNNVEEGSQGNFSQHTFIFPLSLFYFIYIYIYIFIFTFIPLYIFIYNSYTFIYIIYMTYPYIIPLLDVHCCLHISYIQIIYRDKCCIYIFFIIYKYMCTQSMSLCVKCLLLAHTNVKFKSLIYDLSKQAWQVINYAYDIANFHFTYFRFSFLS